MSRQRDPSIDSQAEFETDSTPRKRKYSGIATRGEGINVEGDEPFDPHRFQTFEVTPAFRQSILEAPLPLLELRDRLIEQVPPSHQQRHVGPDDITQPAIATARPSESSPKRPISRPILFELPIPLTRPALKSNLRVLSARRTWLISSALALLVLGLAFVHLYTQKPVSANPAQNQQRAPIDIPLLPIGPTTGAIPPPGTQTVQPAALTIDAPAPQADKNANAVPTESQTRNRPSAVKASSQQAPTKKKLWLPVQ